MLVIKPPFGGLSFKLFRIVTNNIISELFQNKFVILSVRFLQRFMCNNIFKNNMLSHKYSVYVLLHIQLDTRRIVDRMIPRSLPPSTWLHLTLLLRFNYVSGDDEWVVFSCRESRKIYFYIITTYSYLKRSMVTTATARVKVIYHTLSLRLTHVIYFDVGNK